MSNPKIERPNYTQIPNVILDDYLPAMKMAELKVTLAISRQTFGWHRGTALLSVTRLESMTGLSRKGVMDGLLAGLERRTIARTPKGQGFEYSINIDSELCKESDYASNLHTTMQVTNTEVCKLLDPIKEREKNIKKNQGDDDETSPTPADQEKQWTAAIAGKLENVGIGLSAFMLDEYMDVAKQYGIEATIRGITAAAQNGKARTFKYVEACIRNIAQGTQPNVNGYDKPTQAHATTTHDLGDIAR